MEKKLRKSSVNKKLCGVCGGIAEYFNLDPTLIRLLWAVVSLCTCSVGVIAYILAAIIIPVAPTEL